MSFKATIGLLVMVISLYACNRLNETTGVENPASEGFDLANSDPAAVELADSIMVAMGGWENWDNTRFISWSSFGLRNLIWDKKEERARIESLEDSTTYLVDLKTLTGKVFIKGQAVTRSDSLKNMLNRAKNIWSDDAYWLVMPFKLKGSGVTLKYLGEDTLRTGDRCNVLQITYNNDGDMPSTRYHVYVDLADNLVKQWAYYSSASQDSATFVLPWDNYKKYGSILLSADRSEGGGPVDVSVDNSLSEKIFTDLK
ncbi:MAG TPA: hypothetical protein VFG46_07295 [Chryseolinea sp.]|nr:hypothetical protein [Chryseolinea sp.]